MGTSFLFQNALISCLGVKIYTATLVSILYKIHVLELKHVNHILGGFCLTALL